jgi:hypothetical protein
VWCTQFWNLCTAEYTMMTAYQSSQRISLTFSSSRYAAAAAAAAVVHNTHATTSKLSIPTYGQVLAERIGTHSNRSNVHKLTMAQPADRSIVGGTSQQDTATSAASLIVVA